MSREADIREAMHLVWRNLPDGASTFSPCSCGRGNGRGGGPCLQCAWEKLDRLSGLPLQATRFIEAVRQIRNLEAQLLESSE